jgi:hypothetical protein
MPDASRLVDRMLQIFEAWNASGEPLWDLVRDDVRVIGTPPLARADVYVGHAGLSEFAAEAAEDYSSLEVHGRTFRQLDEHQVLVIGMIDAERPDGERLALEATWLCRFDEQGKLASLRTFIRPKLRGDGPDRVGDVPGARATQVAARIRGRWMGETRVLLGLESGATVEVESPPDVGEAFEVGDAATVFLDADGQVLGWYLDQAGRGVDRRGL